MWTLYTIMHKNRKVACIHSNGQCTIYSHKFMPYGLYLENNHDVDTRVNNLENFYHWCSFRLLTLERKYVKEILNTLSKPQSLTDKDRAQIALSYHCLTLTDVFWVKGYKEDICFEEINLYDHSLSDAFVDVCLLGDSSSLSDSSLLTDNDIACNLSTLGVAAKSWIKKDHQFYLYKDGDTRDVEAELLSSKILDCFNIEHISYKPVQYKNHLCTECELMTSIDYGIVPIRDIDIYAANLDQTLMDIISNDSLYEYYMMNIMDYLLGNIDRHWENWGYLVDNSNNKLIKLYPLMDFNKCFLSYDKIEEGRSLTREGLSQKDAAIEAVKLIGINQIKEVEPEWFTSSSQYNMFMKRLSLLKEATNLL